MSATQPTANLVDQSNPQGTLQPVFGTSSNFGGVQIGQSLAYAQLVELRVISYYLYALSAGVPVGLADDPDAIRNMQAGDPTFVVFK